MSALAALMSVTLTACNFIQYQPKAINIQLNAEKIVSKNPFGPEFTQYLVNNGYKKEKLPLEQWGVDELTYCALFFHPSLDIDRAQWRAAEAAVGTAGARPTPSINTSAANNSRANEAKSPYALSLSIDIPIETSNKREIRIENAQHLSLAAKLQIAQSAWQLRNQVALSLNAYQFNLQQSRLLSAEKIQRADIVAIYQKRLGLGAASNVELSTANLLLQASNAAFQANELNRLVLMSSLASTLGISLPKVKNMNIVTDSNSLLTLKLEPDLQAEAVFNRLDLRIALERYAAAEAKLKLEVAKQYPNITISPGYAYEYGDKVWSLGLSGLLSMLNKNKAAINEASSLREVEAAQVEALQSKIMSDASLAYAQLMQAQQVLENQKNILKQQQHSTEQMNKRLSAGEIDRLELTFAKLELNAVEKNLALAYYQLKMAEAELENTLQKPLIQTKQSLDIESISLKSASH
ncbi:MAG: TolC family protein [Methylophilaceae bacterium]|nr:MAG: TolC family protein [Methylophilaceae bacterium]